MRTSADSPCVPAGRSHRSVPFRFLFPGLLLSGFLCALGSGAQQPAPAQTPDTATLAKDVEQLKAQQQLILDRLNELKRLLLTRNAAPAQAQLNVPESVGVSGEMYRGKADAPLAIIEYGDFECPFCRRFNQDAFPQILSTFINTGKVRYYYRDLPLPFHAHAMPAARAARCAGEQGAYWQMYDSLFADKLASTPGEIDERAKAVHLDVPKLDACMAAKNAYGEAIKHSIDDASKMDISGTPTFLIGTVNGAGGVVNVKSTIVGAQPFDSFQSALNALLTPAKAANTPETPAASGKGQ